MNNLTTYTKRDIIFNNTTHLSLPPSQRKWGEEYIGIVLLFNYQLENMLTMDNKLCKRLLYLLTRSQITMSYPCDRGCNFGAFIKEEIHDNNHMMEGSDISCHHNKPEDYRNR